MQDFSRFRAITFDCYGTLIDWEPVLADRLGRWGARYGREFSHAEWLALYDELRQPIQAVRPALLYSDVLRRTIDAIADRLALPLAGSEREMLVQSVRDWKPFPDAVEALGTLRRRYVLGVLSNVDHALFSVTRAMLNDPFEVVVTAEDVGAYKPSHAHFDFSFAAFAKRGIGRGEILHVAQSLAADVVPANALGLAVVWVKREGRNLGRQPPTQPRPDWTVASLAELVPMMRPG
jgi:2-haloacid dehalogenase